MNDFLTPRLIVVWLFGALMLSLQSCDDGSPQLEKSMVQFSLSPGSASQGRVQGIALPEDARLSITIKTRSGTDVFTNHEMQVLKTGDGYTTEPLELVPGSYVISDLVIVDDTEVVNATPKKESTFSAFVTHSLPYDFSVVEGSVANVSLEVIATRNERPEAFGYASFRIKRANVLSFIVSKPKGGQSSLQEATAEFRQGNELIRTFSVRPGMNRVVFEGEPDAMYTLSVYGGDAAKVEKFNFKALKKELGSKPLKVNLEPALLLTIEASVDPGNEYEEYYEFALEGTGGEVNIDWGDGNEDAGTLPISHAHEYTTGTYTAIVTGDLDQITNLYGFSYSTYIYAIAGLTNLTALKTYNPSWGAVPINVDLSNCGNLETIFVEKYGAPYEPIDLRTDFRLPEEHFINEFVFHVTSLDPTRENISAAELDVLVDNIFNNVTERNILNGRFLVYPVDTPSPEAQEKLDILQSEYNWVVRFDGDIWSDYPEAGRVASPDLDERRENWLRKKFPNNKRILRGPTMAVIN